jgi:hypothetical protein
MTNFIYKYNQLEKRISYDDAKLTDAYKKITNYHLGQLKLFMTELFFLSHYYNLDNVLVLYVGAANGYHTHLMARLFPQFLFYLYDKSPFHKIYKDEPLPNVKLFHAYFSHQDAYKYKNNKKIKLLFMCDMRDLDVRHTQKDKNKDSNTQMDSIVMKDMEDQLEWAIIMQPLASYLKFRLPYDVKKFKYFKGKIYIQPYSPLSTEKNKNLIKFLFFMLIN